MALTPEELANLRLERTVLRSAISTGATKVRYRDREATYRSLAEMRDILREMDRTIGEEDGIVRRQRTRQVRLFTSKGLDW